MVKLSTLLSTSTIISCKVSLLNRFGAVQYIRHRSISFITRKSPYEI